MTSQATLPEAPPFKGLPQGLLASARLLLPATQPAGHGWTTPAKLDGMHVLADDLMNRARFFADPCRALEAQRTPLHRRRALRKAMFGVLPRYSLVRRRGVLRAFRAKVLP